MSADAQGLIDVINRKFKEIESLYHEAACRSGITDAEISIWSALLTSDAEYSQQELCKMLYLPRQTVNSIVRNMVKQGYVLLEHVPGSRNRKVIHLTGDGRVYGLQKVMWIFTAEKNALSSTGSSEARAFISMLEKYIFSLRREFNLSG